MFPAYLQETMDKAIELEASFQLVEAVNMAHPTHNPQIMNINQLEYLETLPLPLKKLLTTE